MAATSTSKSSATTQLEADLKLVESCMSLGAFAAGRQDFRRGIEWKISLGLWALLAGATARGFSAFPVTGLIIPLAYGWWLRNLWIRHSSDATIMWNFVNEAQRIIGKHGVKIISPKPNLQVGRGKSPEGWRAMIGFLGEWALGFEFLVTIALTGVLYMTSDSISLYEITLRR